jgi:hypothetical protein
MNQQGITPEEASAIAEGARWAGLDESHHGYIRTYLHQSPAEWMFCCGSACDPCVLTIRRAVDKAREVLGLGALEG